MSPASLEPEAPDAPEACYAETIALIERLHRRFLDLLRVELDRLQVDEINPVQSLLLANIGDDQVSVGELMSRGYYQGSNVTYNLKRLVAAGLVAQERSAHDRRVVRVRLTPAGRALQSGITDALGRQARALADPAGAVPLAALNEALGRLEGFWSERISGRNGPALSNLGDLAEQHRALRPGH
jgi:DNA-binding MarR family transcriptional regulator